MRNDADNKMRFLYSIIIVVFFISLNKVQAAPHIKFEERELDFGEVSQKERVTHIFRFRNIGDDNLVVKKVRIFCDCITGLVSAKSIPPKRTGKIIATFNSELYRKKISKTLYIHLNDPDNSIVSLELKATILTPEIKFYFFYLEDCEDCITIKNEVLDPLRQKYNLIIKSFDLFYAKNYELLIAMEEQYNDTDNKIPVIIIGEYILGGKEEIQKELEEIIQKYKRRGCNFPKIETMVETMELSSKRIYLAYFYRKQCRECERVNYELEYLKNKYPNLLVKSFNVEIHENKELNEALCDLYGVSENRRLITPMIFIGQEFLVKKEITDKKLRDIITKYTSTGTKIPWEEVEKIMGKARSSIRKRFSKMGIFTVLSAGLIDGVNPCAVATIVFFITFLSFIGRKAEEILLVGITFTCVVFIVYFLIGIGLFRFLVIFEFTSIIGKVIFSVAAMLAIIFGILSVYDYFKIRRGIFEEVKLQLPRSLKKRIHAMIRERMTMKNYILAAGIIGLLVSISEFICTGQVYFPTIIFMTEVPHLRNKALVYLFSYNLAFIVPLVIVFGATYKGMRSEVLNHFWRRHIKTAKLVTSILFFLLAGLLIFYIFY